VALYHFRNGIPLTTAAAANFTRGELATALRKVIDLISFFSLILLFQIWGFRVFFLFLIYEIMYWVEVIFRY
jgi:hypothetical protein